MDLDSGVCCGNQADPRFGGSVIEESAQLYASWKTWPVGCHRTGAGRIQTATSASGLSAAILHSSDSLDEPALIRSRSGATATIDAAGQPPWSFVSSIISADEHRQIEAWRDGPRLFEHFREPPLSLPTQRPAGLKFAG